MKKMIFIIAILTLATHAYASSPFAPTDSDEKVSCLKAYEKSILHDCAAKPSGEILSEVIQMIKGDQNCASLKLMQSILFEVTTEKKAGFADFTAINMLVHEVNNRLAADKQVSKKDVEELVSYENSLGIFCSEKKLVTYSQLVSHVVDLANQRK